MGRAEIPFTRSLRTAGSVDKLRNVNVVARQKVRARRLSFSIVERKNLFLYRSQAIFEGRVSAPC